MIQSNNLLGHDNIFSHLINLYSKKILPNKIIFTGKKGVGKYLLAKHFVNYIYSTQEKNKYNLADLTINENNKSNILFQNNSHPNIFKIYKKREKKNIEISQIREMIEFQNKSSFNNNIRTIIIDDSEYLNLNSSNALLKSIEEPHNDILFILINNIERQVLDTLKSRCINFKIILKPENIKQIVNNYFNDNLYDSISKDYLNSYNSPGFLISLIIFMKENKIDFESSKIEKLLFNIIKNKLYIKNTFIYENLSYFVELFFYKNINYSSKLSFKIKDYFYFKLAESIKYNLDLDSLFLEIEEKLLSE